MKWRWLHWWDDGERWYPAYWICWIRRKHGHVELEWEGMEFCSICGDVTNE